MLDKTDRLTDRQTDRQTDKPTNEHTCQKILASNNHDTMHLNLKHQEMHGCVVITVATDALVLKHQVISIHNAD